MNASFRDSILWISIFKREEIREENRRLSVKGQAIVFIESKNISIFMNLIMTFSAVKIITLKLQALSRKDIKS